MTLLDYQNAIVEHGGIRPAARMLGIPESTLRTRIKRLTIEQLAADEEGIQHEFVFSSNPPLRPIDFEPLSDRPRYFILTAAQDSSDIHDDFWKCLRVYADWLENCEIFISGFTYAKTLFEDHDTRSPKVGFHPEIDEFITHNPINIGNGLVFCGEMNTLPTAVKPLSGFETYTRSRWGVFPHPKVQLVSVPTMKGTLAKQIMTTGAVTLPNYIRKKAGIKGSFHHVMGAVLVELASDGAFFCRHLLAKDLEDGSFYDLDRLITSEGVTEGHRVEAITYGDIHHEKLDPEVALATWGYEVDSGERLPSNDSYTLLGHMTLVDFLRPNFEFYHDLSDFTPRNHHNIKDHHFRFVTHQMGTANVEDALIGAARFLGEVHRFDSQIVVVESNHDQALVKWLKTADYREDPENADFFLRTQQSYYNYLARGVSSPPVFEDILRANGCPSDAVFVTEDSSFTICGNIECGMHGHLGANGAKASPNAFARMGAKSNTGHTHSPAILDGAYVSGVSGRLDMGYNKGLSSWAHAHIVTYPNGKRTILTMQNGRFYA